MLDKKAVPHTLQGSRIILLSISIAAVSTVLTPHLLRNLTRKGTRLKTLAPGTYQNRIVL